MRFQIDRNPLGFQSLLREALNQNRRIKLADPLDLINDLSIVAPGKSPTMIRSQRFGLHYSPAQRIRAVLEI